MFQHLVERLPRRVEAVIAAMFQHLVERLPKRVEAVIAAKGGKQLHINTNDFVMRCYILFGHVICVLEGLRPQSTASSFVSLPSVPAVENGRATRLFVRSGDIPGNV
jgi:hypothetical protein